MSHAIPGMKAPEFKAMTTGPKGQQEMSLKDFTSGNKWCLLFFYPMDFGYISPSELLALNSIKENLDKLNCNLFGCSTDSAVVHNKFLSMAPEDGGVKGLLYPLIEDVNGNIAENYGVLRKGSGYTFRSFFLIDNNEIIRMRTVYDLPIGIGCENLPDTINLIQDALGEDACAWFGEQT